MGVRRRGPPPAHWSLEVMCASPAQFIANLHICIHRQRDAFSFYTSGILYNIYIRVLTPNEGMLVILIILVVVLRLAFIISD